MPLGFFLADLDLAMDAQTKLRDEEETRLYNRDAIESFRDLLRDSNKERQYLSEKAFKALIELQRCQAQQHLLGSSRISLANLGYLFGVGGVPLSKKDSLWNTLYKSWESIIRKTPVRILLPELPQEEGSSKAYKRLVEEQIRAFQRDFSWIIKPLRIPIGLEVVVKPPSPSERRGIHDLDNVLRDYIIPRVVDVLQPVTDMAWTIDAEALKNEDHKLYSFWRDRTKRIPASTRIGITRYEAWKLCRRQRDKSPGFVSVAVTADMLPADDILREIDQTIKRWEKIACR
jgi:hypothetical protein